MLKPHYLVFCLLAITSSLAFGGDKKAILPEGAPTAGPYSPGILVNGTLYVAGQVGFDAKSGEIPKAFEDEVKTALANVKRVLDAAGMGQEDAVAVQVYLTDMSLFQRMNAVYSEFFPAPRPARTTVGVASLVGPARIEITVTAYKKPQ